MEDALCTFEAILRNNNDHITAARTAVFTALYEGGLQTMSELQAAAKEHADRTSVYRAVALFERLGIAHRVQTGWKYKVELSDIFVAHHHHISCLGCGKVFAIHEDERIEALIAEIARNNQMSNPVHQLEIQGYCQQCSEQ